MIIVDQTHHADGASDIVCKPDLMVVEDWLHPVYAGIEEINVWGAVSLTSYSSDILASGNKGTAGTLHNDVWVDERCAAPFATVARVGKGYVVFIAAAISNDGRNEKYPGNLSWLTNLSRFLRDDVDKDKARYHSSAAIVTTGTVPQDEVADSRGKVVAGLRVIWPDTEKALRRQIETTMHDTYGED